MNKIMIYYDDELYHHGVKGMKWGVRRYQNKDGSLTKEGRRKYNNVQNSDGTMKIRKGDSDITKRVKRDYNRLSDKEFRGKYAASKKTYLKRVRKYGDPYMKSPLAKIGKKLAAREAYKKTGKMAKTSKDYDRLANKELKTIKKSRERSKKLAKIGAAAAGAAVAAYGGAKLYRKVKNYGSGNVGFDYYRHNMFRNSAGEPNYNPFGHVMGPHNSTIRRNTRRRKR